MSKRNILYDYISYNLTDEDFKLASFGNLPVSSFSSERQILALAVDWDAPPRFFSFPLLYKRPERPYKKVGTAPATNTRFSAAAEV